MPTNIVDLEANMPTVGSKAAAKEEVVLTPIPITPSIVIIPNVDSQAGDISDLSEASSDVGESINGIGLKDEGVAVVEEPACNSAASARSSYGMNTERSGDIEVVYTISSDEEDISAVGQDNSGAALVDNGVEV